MRTGSRHTAGIAGKLFALLALLVVMALPAVMRAGAAQVLVQDSASILSDAEEGQLYEEASVLAQRTGFEVRILTVADAGGNETFEVLEGFMDETYEQEDAVGYIIDMDNREYRIATRGQAIYYLTDDRIEDILNAGGSYMGNGDYRGALSSMMNRTYSYYREGIDSNMYVVDTQTGEIMYYKPPKKVTMCEGLIAAVAGVLSALGISGGVNAKYKMKTGGYRFSLSDNSKMDLQVKRDRLVNSFITTRHIPRNPPSGGGGFGGGGSHSSVHTSSGGHSYGGGGHKF